MRQRCNIIIWAVIFVLVIAYLFIQVDAGGKFGNYDPMSRPDFWPRVVLIGLLVSVLLKFIATARHPRTRQSGGGFLTKLMIPRVLLGIFIVGFYCYMTQYVGFLFGTIVFFPTFMWFLKARKIKLLLFYPTISIIAFLLIFWRLLYLPTPKGSGIFYSFSNFVQALLYRL